MRPRIGIVSIGTHDIARSVSFYQDLGFSVDSLSDADDPSRGIAFFNLDGGMRLVVWSYGFMTDDTGEDVGGAPSITLGHVTATRDEVDAAIARARTAGARIVRNPVTLPWGGYSGYFADPDGHLWEVVWIPPEYGWLEGAFHPDLAEE